MKHPLKKNNLPALTPSKTYYRYAAHGNHRNTLFLACQRKYKKKLALRAFCVINSVICGNYRKFLKKDIQISPYILPLKKELQVCNDNIFDGLFGVFADSLPDGWGKLLLDRHLMSKGINFQDITPLDRLCYVGKFGIGALSYEPIFEEIKTKNQEIILDDLANSSINILNGSSYELLDTLLAIGGSSAGARPKIMAQIDKQNNIIHGSQKLQTDFEHYIIKFPNSNDGLNIGKIEYIYSLMAKKANIEIPDTKLLKDKNTRQAMMIYTRPSIHKDAVTNGMSDFICTAYTHQFIRNNKLIYIVYQRSCDAVFGFNNDLYFHKEIYQRLLTELRGKYKDLQEEHIHYNVGSLHVYPRHHKLLEKI